MRKVLSTVFCSVFAMALFAQSNIKPEDIISKINNKQTVVVENAVINGDLDLTTPIINKKPEKTKDKDITTNLYCLVEIPVTFKNCVFKGDIIGYLPDEKTKEKETIYSVQFLEGATFSNCTFEGKVDFKYTKFDKKGEFKDSKFSKLAFFKYAKFPTKALFNNTAFKGETSFKYSEFPAGVSFENAIFDDEVTFKYVELADKISFKNVKFNDMAVFKYTSFPKGVDFSGAKFENYADFKYAKIYKEDFEKAEFKGEKDTKYISLK